MYILNVHNRWGGWGGLGGGVYECGVILCWISIDGWIHVDLQCNDVKLIYGLKIQSREHSN